MSLSDHTSNPHFRESDLFKKISDVHEAQMQLCLNQKEVNLTLMRIQMAIEELLAPKYSTFKF